MKTLGVSPLVVLASAYLARAQSDPETVWAKITPSTDLVWTTCYTTFECARFQVPLDWTHPTNATTALALIRVPSTLSKSDKAYRGPMLFNPGGPGNPGVDAILQRGIGFQKIIGQEYDIVSFDPRGFGRTTPTLRPFLDASEHTTWSVHAQDDPPLGATPDAVARTYARFQFFGKLAQDRIGDIAPYVGTPAVARDMLAITEAAGFPKLKYWGVSYGTALGATFASMFPDKVERIILDGNLDVNDYYKAQWSTNLQTTDKAVERFADACAQVGPSKCALYESSGKKVYARLQKIFDQVKSEPIPVYIGNGTLDYGIIDYALLRRNSLPFFAVPFAVPAETTALMFAGLEKGNGTLFWQNILKPSVAHCTSGPDTNPLDLYGFAVLGIPAVACLDAEPVTDTISQLQKWYENNAKQSTWADVWPFRVVCAGWKIRPAEPFKGTVGGNTSFPIMFIGNIADATTPLRNAQTMSKLFNGSSILALDTPGHTSLVAPSVCRDRAIRAYFRDGVLPKTGTVCPIDTGFFQDTATNATTSQRRNDLMALGRVA